MVITALDGDLAMLKVSRAELVFLNNAVNEVCNGARDLEHDGEFASRLGWSREDARQLLAELHAALGECRPA